MNESIIGARIDSWQILSIDGRRATCRCTCGSEHILATDALLGGTAARSCGCAPGRIAPRRSETEIKRTGARRKALASAIERGDLFGQVVARLALPRRFDKVGRPKENTARTELLRAYLIWIGRPDLPVSELTKPSTTVGDEHGEDRRQQVIAAYEEVGSQTLQRDAAAVQREIWGDGKASELKDWGRSVRADEPLVGGRKEPEWKKAGAPSRATYYRRRRRQAP
jgi:hypothetical protein